MKLNYLDVVLLLQRRIRTIAKLEMPENDYLNRFEEIMFIMNEIIKLRDLDTDVRNVVRS